VACYRRIDVHYRDYLHLDVLLDLQHPQAPPGEHRVYAAEHFFIVVHQSCELWLAQILLDLDQATAALTPTPAEPELALEHLRRVADTLSVLHSQITTLDQLPSHSFARFRPHLGTASGAQSTQFRTLDRALGLHTAGPAPIITAFTAATAGYGLATVDVCHADLQAGPLHRILETLLDIAQRHWRWKIAHLSLVSRLLPDTPGTGGTTGTEYLARRTTMPFPELRAAQRTAHAEITPATPDPTVPGGPPAEQRPVGVR
jgi:tryptophan 2,3-dioxygenase